MIGSGSASGFFRGRIRIRLKMIWIRNTAHYPPLNNRFEQTFNPKWKYSTFCLFYVINLELSLLDQDGSGLNVERSTPPLITR
jgi:hypothetical protein